MNRKKAAIGFGVLVVAALGGALGYIGPRNVVGMIRYDQRQEGTLHVGDKAPDVELLAPSADAKEPKQRLSAYIGEKPLVLIFGSFT